MTDIAPMNIRAAIEVMKIIGPHAEQITATTEPVKVMKGIIDGAKSDSPIQVMRLLALMERKPLEELAEEMFDSDGADLLERLTDGFTNNHLGPMIDAAFYLGFATERWSYVE